MNGELDELDALLEEAEQAIEDGDFERAEEMLSDHVLAGDGDLRAVALYGLALYFQGEFDEAGRHLERVHAELTDDPDIASALAVSRFYGGDFATAEQLLRSVIAMDPEWADAHWWLGRVLDWQGKEAAHGAFAEAARLDPATYSIPESLSDEEFQSAVQDAMDELPERISEASQEVAVVVERYPDLVLLGESPVPYPAELLGLYTGVPLSERSTFDSGRPPDVIHLFKRNLELATSDPAELRHEIRVTLIHEMGHYLGLEEDDLDELGIG
jgi:predicted Zn-dependent protease with MMP-like domain/Flp pilus assembly protein TadD